MTDPADIRILHEFIAALDRRRPQAQRAGEAAIARDAAALKARALARLAELAREHVVREQKVLAIVAGTIALGAVIGCGLLSS